MGESFALAQPSETPNAIQSLQQILGLQRAEFVNYPSAHFLLASDAGQASAKETLLTLESTYQHVRRWADALQLPVKDAHETWPVVYFQHKKNYRLALARMGVASHESPGLYLPSAHVALFLDITNLTSWQVVNERIARWRKNIQKHDSQSQQDNNAEIRHMRKELATLQFQQEDIRQQYQQLVIGHEAAHMILNGLAILNPQRDNPDWLSEGLACQFEFPFFGKDLLENNRISSGGPDANESRFYPLRPRGINPTAQGAIIETFLGTNPWRLADLKQALTLDFVNTKMPPADDATKAGRAIVPLSALVMENKFPTRSAQETAWRYAQSWALVYYLQNHHPTAWVAYLACQANTTSGTTNHRLSPCLQTTFMSADSTFSLNWLRWLGSLMLDPSEGRR